MDLRQFLQILGYEFNQYKSSFSLKFSFLIVAQSWRKSRFHLSDCKGIPLNSILHIMINWTKNLDGFNQIRFDWNSCILNARKESIVELIYEICLEIFIFNCAEIIKSFNFYEFLACWWFEVCWDSDDSSWNTTVSDVIDQLLFTSHWIVIYISKHYDSILIILEFMFLHKTLDILPWFIKSNCDCSSSTPKLLIDKFLNILSREIFYVCAF